MEKASYRNQHCIRNMKQMHGFKVKVSSFDYNSNLGDDGDLVATGFSWPPRSYICSFCKREFRSAQALGGHMNVHRRDRARLRQSPARDGGNKNGGQFSLLNLNLEPNPSLCSSPNSCPSFFPSSPPTLSSLVTKFPQFTSKLPPPSGGDAVPVQYGRPMTADLMKLKVAKGLRGVERFKKGCEEFLSLELGMGLISPSMEDLDLELRLGCN